VGDRCVNGSPSSRVPFLGIFRFCASQLSSKAHGCCSATRCGGSLDRCPLSPCITDSQQTSGNLRFVPEGDIGDLVPYNRGRRLRRPHFLRRRRVGHPFYVIVRGDDRRRPNVVVCFHYLDCFDTACRKDGPGARKVVSDLALDSRLCRAIGAAGTPDPW
jgi:hypothetical protein